MSGTFLEISLGTREQPAFRLTHPFVAFRLEGGPHPFRCALNLWCNGRIVATATGDGKAGAPWRSWDVRPWFGREVQLQAVKLPGTTGERLGVLAWAQVATPKGDVEPTMAAAIVAVQREARALITAAQPRAEADPLRPRWHFLPPAQRMNDPNGPFFANGWYHLFYQWNVFSDRMGEGLMCWGHARSRDLVQWEHLPVALWPQWEHGEMQCFSGGAFVAPDGRPRLFYTRVPAAGHPRSQCLVQPVDQALLAWRRHPANPVLDLATQDGPPMDERWRDPFVFSAGGRTFMLLAAEHVPIFEATDASLTHWTYRGVFYDRPGLSVECPNFFQFGDRWIFLMSPKGPVEYVVGTFYPEAARFTPELAGCLSRSRQFYATHGLHDPVGRLIVFGVIKGFPGGRGWRDCLAWPRVITPGPDGHPRQEPIAALQQLRGDRFCVTDLELRDDRRIVPGLKGDLLELAVEFELRDATVCGLVVRCGADGERGITIRCADRQLQLAGVNVPLVPDGGRLRLRILLDRGALEVFAGDGRVAEVVIVEPDPTDLCVAWFAQGGAARLVRLEAWTLRALDFGAMPWVDPDAS